MLKTLVVLICFVLVPTGAWAQSTPSDARRLALSGQRRSALELLAKRLEANPGDIDARILYGTVLSWDGDYPKARAELSRVLVSDPNNGDAMQALANVELWTNHPAQAEDLLLRLVRSRPSDSDILLAHARALNSLNRTAESLAVLDRLLELDPSNRSAFDLRAGLSEVVPRWEMSVRQYYESFSDGIGNRLETQAALKHSTPLGAVIGRYSGASRFGDIGNQVEMDFYPGLRKGTYLYLNAGFSPEGALYPKYRAAGEFFQALGRGFEGSAGYRRMGFSTPVNVFSTSVSKYHGSWLYSARGYFTPNIDGAAKSFQVSARRYMKDVRSYVEFGYGHGSTPYGIRSAVDLQIFNADSWSATIDKAIGRHWLISGNFGLAYEERSQRPSVYHRTGTLSLSTRF